MRDPQREVDVESRLEEADREINRLTEQNEKYRDALVQLEQIAHMAKVGGFPGGLADALATETIRVIRDAVWTPVPPDSYPET